MTCEIKTIAPGGGGSSTPDLTIQDEGVDVQTGVDTINFVGGLVSAVGSGPNGATVTINIPEYTTDPVSPAEGDAWVLRTSSGGGLAFGLLPHGLVLGGGGGGSTTYEFSYKTQMSGIKRVTLT